MNQTRNEKTILIAGSFIVAALLAGLIHLFILRFQTGDIYPPYSSLRYDPLGTRAFYESLSACNNLAVERSFKPMDKLNPGPDTTMLFLGDTVFTLSNEERMPKDLAAFVNSFVRRGGRVVITLLPRNVGKPSELMKAISGDEEEQPLKKAKKQKDKTDEDKTEEKKDDSSKPLIRKDPDYKRYIDRTITVSKWLGLEFCDRPVEARTFAHRDDGCSITNFPESLSCHTSLCLSNVSSAWTVIYRRDELPVIAEQRIGKGALVISTLSYFVSNEAMRDERQPALLAWLIGDSKRIVFDEQHLGIAEQVGIATLARQYRLQWFAGAAFLLALLFVWQRIVSIVPAGDPAANGNAAHLAIGKDSTSGLINLLRRSVSGANILETCFNEWRKSQHSAGRAVQAKTNAMHQALMRRTGPDGRKRKQIEIYNEMSSILKKQE